MTHAKLDVWKKWKAHFVMRKPKTKTSAGVQDKI